MDATTHLVVLKAAPTVNVPTMPSATAVCYRSICVLKRSRKALCCRRTSPLSTLRPMDAHNPFPSKQQCTQRDDGRQLPPARNDNGFKSPGIYDRFGNPVNFQDLQRKLNTRGREAGSSSMRTSSCPTLVLSTTTDPHDPIWTADSGCTRNAAYQESWFKDINP
ncbi:hypothetical protein ON010_g5438 [Phytophthora cinnamomi]|nr:hypothetical protein ON010_g5438 [Phytophthora cinnamomi]